MIAIAANADRLPRIKVLRIVLFSPKFCLRSMAKS